MSKTVDERVVSMQFDNKNFESNVQTSLSTLDKLKQSLNLTGASKGLENVSAAAKNVDMSTLGGAVESVRVKFSALEVMGITALTNITNSALNAGKRIASALTIEPVKTGFNEYELKMDSIKTIMASTGEKVETVNKYLDELNEYSDKTIYSFSDMTQNIGKFTNAGVKLEDAVLAIKGISNEAAVSGVNSNEASRAMYNFAQALSAGYVQLLDWKSIDTANMATVEFKQQLIDTAVELGTVTKSADGMYSTLEGNAFNATKNFNNVLQDQWMTTDVLVKTLGKYADETTDIGKKAYAAAQDVTKLSQVFGIAKETAQSGWAKTWEILFGDIDKAKALFTPLSNFLNKVIDGVSDFRNNLLEGALSKSPWAALTEKLDNSGLGTIKKYADSITNISDKLSTFQSVVSNVWRGDYGVMESRWNKLDEEGHNSKVIQDLVNLGYDHKITVEDVEASYKKYGLTLDKTTNSAEKMTSSIEDLSDAQLEEAGFTEQEIKLYRELQAEAKRTGKPIKELIDDMSETDGRTLLIDSLKNAGSGLVGVFTALKNAWVEIFPPMTSIQLFNIIKAINEFSEKLRLTNKETGELTDNAKNLQRTFKGIFAVLDMVTTIIGGPLKIAFKIISKILDAFGFNILDVTAVIGDALVGFRDWIDSTLDFTKIFDNIVEWAKQAKEAFSGWFDGLMQSEDKPKYIIDGIVSALKAAIEFIKDNVSNIGQTIWSGIEGFLNGLGIDTSGITKLFENIVKYSEEVKESLSSWFAGLAGAEDKPKYIINGLISALKSAIKFVGETASGIGSIIWTNIEKALNGMGIDTSGFTSFINGMTNGVKKFIDEFSRTGTIPQDMIAGLVNGLQDGIKTIANFVWELGKSIITTICDVLGIHSPSTEMMEVGTNVVAGLVQGVQNGSSSIMDTFKGMFSKCIEALKRIDFGTLFAAGFSSGMLIVINKFANALNKLANPLDKLGDVFQGVGNVLNSVSKVVKSFSDVLKSLSFNIKIQAIKTLAVALAILVGCLVVLAFIPTDKIWSGIAAIAALAAIVSVLAVVVSKCGGENAADFVKFSLLVVSVSVAILVIAAAIKSLGSIDSDKIGNAYMGFATIIIAFMILIKVFGSCVNEKQAENIDKLGFTLLKIATAIMIMAQVIKILGGMDPISLLVGMGCIVLFGGIITGLIAATKLAGKRLKYVGNTILQISAAIMLMAITVKLIGGMEPSKLAKGMACIILFGGVITGLIAATKLVGKRLKYVGNTILGVGAAILIMALTAKLIGETDAGQLAKGIICITLLSGIIVGLIAATNLGGKRLKYVGKTLLLISFSIAILAGVAVLLGLIDIVALAKGIIAMHFLTTMMIGLIAVTSLANDCKGNIIAIAVAIGVLAAAVSVLSFIDPARLAVATACLSAVMFIFSLVIKSARFAKKALGPIIAITVAIGLLGGVLYLLSTLPAKSVLGSAIALSIVLGAMVVSFTILSKAGNLSAKSVGVLILMGIVVAEIAIILGALTALDVAPSIETASALSILLATMAGVCIVISKTNVNVAAAVQGALALDAFIAILGALILAIGALSQIPGFNDLISSGGETLGLIGYAIGNFIGSIVGGFGAGLTSGLPEMAANLSMFMILLTPFIAGAKMLDASTLEGVQMLVGVILALTAAGVLDGIASWLTGGSSILKFASELKPLGTGLREFSEEVSGVDPEAIKSAAVAAKALAEMTSCIPNEGGVVGWFTGENSISKFAGELKSLGTGLREFSEEVVGVDPEAIKSAAVAAKALAEMTSCIPNEGGVVGWFTGENSISKFASELKPLGTGLREFSEEVSGVDPEAIIAASNAAKALAEMTASIPNEGGVVGWFTGENSISKFAGELWNLGMGLNDFARATPDVDPERVKAAVDAAKTLADMASTIPNEGGVASWFAGENSISKFAGELEKLGTGLNKFSNAIPDVDPEKVKAASNAAKTLAEMTQVIPTEGGIEKWFSGETSISKFADEMGNLGVGLNDFSMAVAGVSPDKVTAAANAAKTIGEMTQVIPNQGGIESWFGGEKSISAFAGELKNLGDGINNFSNAVKDVVPDKVTAAANAAKTLAEMTNTVPEDTSRIISFGENIKVFGGYLLSYFRIMSDVKTEWVTLSDSTITAINKFVNNISPDKVSSASDAISKLIETIKGMSDITGETTSGFTKAMKNLGEANVSAFIKAFEDSKSKIAKTGQSVINSFIEEVKNQSSKISESGKTSISKFIEGVNGKKTDAKTAFENVVKACKSAISDYKDDFKIVGKNLVSGFADGISENTYKVEAQAKAMAEAAEKAAREVLDINSPSKVFRKIGGFVPEGFAQGIDRLSGLVRNSAEDMARDSVNSALSAVSYIADVINSDIDAEPTIRPVLDLTNVRSGANAISGLLSGRRTLSINTDNVGSISASMSRRQNGNDSSEIVSSIRALRDDIANMPRNSYVVNGVTYDDGSNISIAVKDLVRAARIERRI